MRKLTTLFLAVAVYALMGIGGAAADDDSRKRQQRPDSMVACISFGQFFVDGISLPDSIDASACRPGGVTDKCASCIRSLENQGCSVLDLVVPVVETRGYQSVYVLSCERP